MGVDRAGQANGGGADVWIYDDFNAVLEAAEFDDVSRCRAQLERFQARANGGVLKFAANIFGHSGKLGEATDGATGSCGEARVGIEVKLDAFRVSGHEYPRG